MLNPGSYVLCNRQITSALNGEIQTGIDGLEGIKGATITAKFAHGSNGTTLKCWVQYSPDGGENFYDACCFAFTTASAVKQFNFSGLTPKTTVLTPSQAALGDDTCVDGPMGSIWRCVLTSTGTYSNTVIRVDIEAR